MGSIELPQDAPLFRSDTLLAGKYRVQRLIGRGGMAEVYAATHEVLQQTVALKLLLPEIASSPEATARFLNEARAAARIRGENVAAVMDVGTLPEGAAYMVLEYLEGEDLEMYAQTKGRLAPGEAVDYVLQALQALAQAHALGIIHRDIKPSNLFLSSRPDGSSIVKVLDFGISKTPRLLESGGGHATATRAVLGSPYYMAPEQARSAKSVDPRADVWAIGVTLYRFLTGELPFGGETLTELLLAIVEASPRPPRALCPDLPRDLEAVVLRCLRKDRADRYANVAELALALRPFAASEGPMVDRIGRTLGVMRAALSAPEILPSSPPTTPAPVVGEGAAEGAPGEAPPASSTLRTAVGAGTHASWAESRPGRPVGSRRPLWLLAGAAILALAAAGLVMSLHGSHPAASVEPPEPAAAPVPPPESPAAKAPPELPALPVAAPEPPPTAAVSLPVPEPPRPVQVPARHTPSAPVAHPVAAPVARPAASAHPSTASPAATASSPTPAKPDTYDVLNQRN